MCKVLAIAGLDPKKLKYIKNNNDPGSKIWDFMLAVSPFMSQGDKDGLGYAAMGETGLWGERWWHPKDYWNYREEWTQKDQEILEKSKGSLEAGPRYNVFGDSDPENTFAVLLHARMATCEKSLRNVHPFVRDGMALIHNGVIRNTPQLKNLTSTCDSETILNAYVDLEVNKDPEKMQSLSDKLRGYYACALLGKDKDGVEYVDIFKDDLASLTATYVKQLDAMVYCTSADIVKAACRKLGWKTSSSFRCKDESFVRLNARTGEVVFKQQFKSGPRWSGGPYTAEEWGRWRNYENAPESALPKGTRNDGGTTTVGEPQAAVEDQRSSTTKDFPTLKVVGATPSPFTPNPGTGALVPAGAEAEDTELSLMEEFYERSKGVLH
jgi:hypothetical protein